MGIYQKVCYKVEDVFVNILTKKEDPKLVREKVTSYRTEKEKKKAIKKAELEEKRAHYKKEQELKEEQEKQEVLAILSKVVDINQLEYSQYEYQEVKRNKAYFESVLQNIFEKDEYGFTFLACEFDKSSKKETKGYLFATNKRVWFVGNKYNSDFQQKFRYQTIKNVQWFKDGLLERGLKMQYGVKKLEFDEIFDFEQMKRFGDLVLNEAAKY
ncbi:PH domain-containing protein [Pseudalkalibacillus sp. R45]|uniref:PH domain-containing protein n=1 Tax=Pseudalkalibacillus sp. R45 TaxID=3457433 RepID=UPI003FCC460A